MSALRTLLAIVDIETGGAESKLAAIDSSLSRAKEALGGLAAAALGAFSVHAVSEFIHSQIELGSVLNDTSEKLGIGTTELQKFQYAAQLSGVGAEESANALRFLNKSIGEVIDGNAESAKQFAKLGVEVKNSDGTVRELGDVIPEVADAFEKMGSDQERTTAAMSLFGRSGASLIPLLKQGSGELRKMNDEFVELGLGIDESFIKEADAAGDRLETLKLGFRALKTRLAAEVLPTVADLATKLSKAVAWVIRVARETNLMKEAWLAMGVGAAVAFAKVSYGLAKMYGFVKKGSSIFSTFVSLGQFGLIVAAFVLLALALEDIVTLAQGGSSVIGDFITQSLGIEKTQELVESLNSAWADMQPAIDEIGPILASLSLSFGKALPAMIGLVLDLVKALISAGIFLEKVGEFIGELVTGGGIEGLNRVADRHNEQQKALWKGGSTFFNVLSAPEVPATGVRQPTGFTRGDTKIEVNVNGGPTNADTGRSVSSAVNGALEDADRRAAAQALFNGAGG